MPYPGMMMPPPNMAQMEFDRRNMQQQQPFGGAGGTGGEDEDGNGENEGVGVEPGRQVGQEPVQVPDRVPPMAHAPAGAG